MKTCEKCGVELTHGGLEAATTNPAGGLDVHTPERCRDRLAARLAEVERENKELRDALAHQTSVADTERGRADRAEEALAECGRAGCPTAAGRQ